MVTSALAPKPQPAPAPAASPVRRPVDGADLMRYFSHEFDHMMRDLGVRERWPFLAARGDAAWVPDLDLPGMKAEEVKVSVTDAGFTIEGERRQQKSRTESGYVRSERSYGRFCRSVPLPEGARTDTAKASFADGVLEITVAIAPPQPAAVRTLEITSAGGSTPA